MQRIITLLPVRYTRNVFVLGKSLATGLLLTSTTSYATQYEFNQHIALSYDSSTEYHNTLLGHADRYSANFSLAGNQDDQYTFEERPLADYLTIREEKDWQYLKEQTYTIFGLSVATVIFMTFLPEEVTNWEDEDKNLSEVFEQWKDNVSEGPVWDKDKHYLNYIMHPYFGGVYYTAARHSGFDEFESFIYSWTMSTFFWEYGVEAFAEVPSWQDLFITPVFGALVGEMMFEAEQDIVLNDGKVFGSNTMGDISLFLLNPVGHIHYWAKDTWGGGAEFNFSSNPWFNNQDAAIFAIDAGAPYDASFIGGELTLRF